MAVFGIGLPAATRKIFLRRVLGVSYSDSSLIAETMATDGLDADAQQIFESIGLLTAAAT
jgi:hypothetical protein